MSTINVDRQGLNTLTQLIDICLNAKELKSAVKQITDAHDAFLKDQNAVERLKQADELTAQANKFLADAVATKEASKDYASNRRKEADEAFNAREEALKQGEAALEKARQEFNEECANTRKALSTQQAQLESDRANMTKERDVIAKREKELQAEITKFNGLNKKLEFLNDSVRA